MLIQSNQHQFPYLYMTALDILPAQASSISSERVFYVKQRDLHPTLKQDHTNLLRSPPNSEIYLSSRTAQFLIAPEQHD